MRALARASRERARRQIWRVPDLPRDLQNPLARRFIDAVASMQGTIDGPDRNVGQIRD